MNPSKCENGDSLSVDVSKPQILGTSPWEIPKTFCSLFKPSQDGVRIMKTM